MASDTNDYRLKYVLGGIRHDGTKGRKYTLWKEGFLDAAQGHGDDDYSWAQVFLGTVHQNACNPRNRSSVTA